MTIKNIKDREIALQARVAELEAQIEASRKQEAVAWKYIHIPSWNIGVSIDHPEKMDKWDDLRLLEIEPLFAAQVVAPDVLKDAELGKTAMRFVDRAGDVHPGIDDAETICADFYKAMMATLDAAMGGAND